MVKREYNGLVYDSDEEILHSIPIDVTMALSQSEKLTMEKAVASFNFHHFSYKYGPQVVLAIFSRNYPIRQSRSPQNRDWARTEVVFPISQETVDFFLEAARVTQAKLKGIL